MSSYSLTLWTLLWALLAQSLATGLATECFLRKGLTQLARRCWLALALASLLLALQHAYALELAVRTGLHDLRQGVLGASAATLLALVVVAFRHRES